MSTDKPTLIDVIQDDLQRMAKKLTDRLDRLERVSQRALLGDAIRIAVDPALRKLESRIAALEERLNRTPPEEP